MFNLTEQWKAAYDVFLEEEYKKVDDEFSTTFQEMEIATKEVINAYNILEEYFSAFGEAEMFLTEQLDDETLKDNAGEKAADRKEVKDSARILTNLRDANIKLLNMKSIAGDDYNFTKIDYEAIPSAETVEKISDMKFPKNIIFFIKQIVNWIAKVVIYFIEKIKNIVRVVFGMKPKELDKNYLKLSLEKTKKIETMKGTSVVQHGKDSDPIKIFKLNMLDAEDINQYNILKEECINEGVLTGLFKDIKPANPEKVPMFVSIDVSKDLIALKEQIQHFLDLYEYAIGSNNEHLFKTDDLETILEIFKTTISDIKQGRSNTYEVGSSMVEFSAIDSNRVKDNLVKTNINLENLKNAYMQTAAKIKDITNIIGHKQLLLLSQSGLISYSMVSSGTLYEMQRILEIIEPKIRQSSKLEKDLEKTQKKYNMISSQLQKMQQLLGAVSNLTYSTVYQRRITDLFNSARYMSQTVSLRLTAVGLYIKALKEVRESVAVLARLNSNKR